jgi:hypothetical protein
VETGRDPSFSNADPTWRQLLMVEGLEEPETRLLRAAAAPLAALEAEPETRPEEVVHPHRRDLGQDRR